MPNPKHTEQNGQNNRFAFTRINYLLMIAGIVVICIGYLLMVGGGTDNPEVFNPDELYSFRRITLAPIVIISGFIIEVFAILYKPRE